MFSYIAQRSASHAVSELGFFSCVKCTSRGVGCSSRGISLHRGFALFNLGLRVVSTFGLQSGCLEYLGVTCWCPEKEAFGRGRFSVLVTHGEFYNTFFFNCSACFGNVSCIHSKFLFRLSSESTHISAVPSTFIRRFLFRDRSRTIRNLSVLAMERTNQGEHVSAES